MRILITGATGLVGRHFIQALRGRNIELFVLARSKKQIPGIKNENILSWNSNEVPNLTAIGSLDAVVHLAGEGIADKRWTEKRKQALRDSRVQGTSNLVTALSILPQASRPKLFLCASAIGYYGDTKDLSIDESSLKGQGFLSDLCHQWEQASLSSGSIFERQITMRLGVVLASDGGALKKMAPVILGSGQQWFSWIHIQDLIHFMVTALEDSRFQGTFNLTSPHPVTQAEFAKALAKQWKIPIVPSVPEFVMKAALGEMSSMLLTGQKVIPQRLIQMGFKFQYPGINEALQEEIL